MTTQHKSERFDLVVVGSGPGGYKAAIAAAHMGRRVALVEKGLEGGTCLNHGCIPKKTLLYMAGLIEDVNSLNGRGILGTIRGDFYAALAHKEQVIANIRDNFPVWLKRLGVKVFKGRARFTGPGRLEIYTPHGRRLALAAERTILATGSEPRQLTSCVTDGERIINSRDFMLNLRAIPRSVLCVGGGAIGVELAFLMHQFGARVTIVERSSRLLNKPCIPERASNALERKLRRIGVEVRKDVTVASREVHGGTVQISFTDGTSAAYEQVLVAVGRRPRTRDMGLENAGIAVDSRGFIVTNEYLQTTAADVYAVGDVKLGPMTANAALHDAKVAATNAVSGNELRPNYNRVPLVVDSALEIAAVGLTEDRAEDAGFEPETARANFSGSPKSRGRHDYDGFIEVVHDEETGQMLGGCIVGPEAGEQIHMLTAACQSPKGLWFLKEISYSHPSWCEELENAIDPYMAAFIQSDKSIFRPGIYAMP